MAANVGLSTPRGSGTSGYVQRNHAALKPRSKLGGTPYSKDMEQLKHKQRQPDKDILEHDRRREIEVKVFELRDRLEDEGVDEDEIEEQTDALRKKLEDQRKAAERRGNNTSGKGLKQHQVHELAKAKIQESEKMRQAFGIRKDYEEGSHWRRQELRRDREKHEQTQQQQPPQQGKAASVSSASSSEDEDDD